MTCAGMNKRLVGGCFHVALFPLVTRLGFIKGPPLNLVQATDFEKGFRQDSVDQVTYEWKLRVYPSSPIFISPRSARMCAAPVDTSEGMDEQMYDYMTQASGIDQGCGQLPQSMADTLCWLYCCAVWDHSSSACVVLLVHTH